LCAAAGGAAARPSKTVRQGTKRNTDSVLEYLLETLGTGCTSTVAKDLGQAAADGVDRETQGLQQVHGMLAWTCMEVGQQWQYISDAGTSDAGTSWATSLGGILLRPAIG
jgi:hypothetical protein